MTEAVRVEPTVVILPSTVWLSELSTELERLGVKPEESHRSARHLLHRVVGRAGYRTKFLVDADESQGDRS